jgi:hypothetical protein
MVGGRRQNRRLRPDLETINHRQLTMFLILLSLIVNVLVAGYMGTAIGFSLNRALPRLDEVFGPDTPARRILACL